MSRLDELQKMITGMSTEELMDLHREIRTDRRVSKRVQKTTKKSTRVKAKTAAAALLDGMTDEARAELIAVLKGEG